VLTWYRAYDADLGRWLSPDPLESTSGEIPELLPEGSNLYAYVGNNSPNYHDPDGQAVPIIIVGILAVIAGTGEANAPGPGDKQYNTPPPIAQAGMAGLGLCAGGAAAKGAKKGFDAAARGIKRQAAKVKFYGPDVRNGGRIFGVRLKTGPNLFRLDYAAYPFSGGGAKVSKVPRLHCHIGPNEGKHISIDPRDLFRKIKGLIP
jgi:RHS repeat-associated protein